MKIAIYTLGCKVNQYETQAMEKELTGRGHTLVDFEEQADAYIVNTCTVTAVSDKKSRQMIRRARKQNPDAVVAVCGCYAQTKPEEIRDLEVDLISGTGDRIKFLDLLENAVREKEPVMSVDQALRRREFEILPAGGMAQRTRAMLKVEDGCVNFCTYCIIPYARGPVRSLPLEAAVEQTRQLRQEGYREIVITGIEISSWGHDLRNGQSLIDLLEAISGAAGSMRIRLGSLEPRTITEDFCVRASKLPNLCPHFHLSLQSGCDATLARMNRKYDTARYKESVRLLNVYFGHPAITTDLITGFPGETEEEFAQTLEHIRSCRFAEMHIFPYSIRTGTPAAEMEQVPKAVKEERSRAAAAVAEEMRGAYLEACVGRTYPVLYEQTYDGLWHGHAPNYATVAVKSGSDLHNRVIMTRITAVENGLLVGEPAELELVRPAQEHAEAIMDFRREMLDAGSSMDGCGILRRCETAQEWLDDLKVMDSQVATLLGKVPSTTYLALRRSDGRVVGVIDLRHHIEHPVLKLWGGHIGYCVRPSERRRGYAAEMLRLGLEKARERGLEQVMVTCHEGNEGSEKTILRNGGVYEKTVTADTGRIKRFWIQL